MQDWIKVNHKGARVRVEALLPIYLIDFKRREGDSNPRNREIHLISNQTQSTNSAISP